MSWRRFRGCGSARRSASRPDSRPAPSEVNAPKRVAPNVETDARGAPDGPERPAHECPGGRPWSEPEHQPPAHDSPARATRVATWSELRDRQPAYALVANVDLVVVRYDDQVSVLYGRCLHRGALLSDGFVRGDDLICGLHEWDYRYDTGVSSYNPEEVLQKFTAWVDTDADAVFVDEAEVAAWHAKFPQPYRRDEYLGLYADVHGTPEEPHNHAIHELARNGLKGRPPRQRLGHGRAARGTPTLG